MRFTRHAVAFAALLVVGLAGTGCSGARSGQAVPEGDGGQPRADSSATAGDERAAGDAAPGKPVPSWGRSAFDAVPRAHVGVTNRVAQASASAVAVYSAHGGSTPWKTLKSSTSSKTPLVLLVQEQDAEWVRVLLPVRPNGAQGWVKAKDVKIFQHDYRMVVSVGKHTLTVYKGSSAVMTEKVGLGRSTTPTPGGVFYTKELLRPPDPKGAYGPYAYGLSGFSPVLDEFLGGDGQLGLHGTNDPSGLGKDVSHGCIRIQNAAIEKLAAMLPLGVPIQIVD